MRDRLYISDLDGTLLRNDATLSDYSKTKIQELVGNGVHFSVASARSVVAIQKIFVGVKLNLPVIEFNGAFISDLETGHHEVINEIDKSITSEILSLSLEGQKFSSAFCPGLFSYRLNTIPFLRSKYFRDIDNPLFH